MAQSTVPSKATLNPPSNGRSDLEEARPAAFIETGRSFTSGQDLDRVLTLILTRIADLLAVEATALLLIDQDGDLVYKIGTVSNRNPIPFDGLKPAQQSIAQIVAQSGKPSVVNTAEDSLIPSWTASDAVKIKAKRLLCVPVVSDDNVIGVIEVINHVDHSPFTQNDARLLACLADQISAALNQADLYQRVRQAELDKSDFIDFVSHELNQPMTAIQGYAKMLTMGIGGELSGTQRQFIEVINANVSRMSKLVSDLLQLSRLEAGRTRLELAPVSLHEIVQEVVGLARAEIEARHHTLTVNVPSSLPLILGDREHLVRILGNLVRNAYQYTPKGGFIRIVAEVPTLSGESPGYLRVSVHDTGIGMSAQEIARLDERFFRGEHSLVQQQPGSGLGVLIARGLVQLHGGDFQVESTPERGSTFLFTIPLAGS